MKNVPELHTRRCVLREITPIETEALHQMFDDELFMRFLPELYDMVKTEDGLLQFLHSFETYAKDGEGILWGIETSGVLIGFVAIMDISYDPLLFYTTHPHYRRQGFAKEVVSEIVRFFKEEHPYQELSTEVYQDNQASLAILQHCGFVVSGRQGNKILMNSSTVMHG